MLRRNSTAPAPAGWRASIIEFAGLLLALAVMVAWFGFTTQNFFTVETFRSIANQAPAITLAATGMTFVLLIGGIDLSAGAVLGLAGAVLGVVVLKDIPLALPMALLAALGAGALCGLANGAISVRWAVPAFIVTLGMMEIARGGAYLVTDSRTQYIGSPIGWIADASLFGFSLPFAIALATVVVAQILLNRTVFGRYVKAIGANEEAVRLAGVDPRPIKVAVYVLSGTLAAGGAILQTARLQSADPNAGYGMELQAIAAAVIGGTSLLGGSGSAVGTFLGVLIMGVLNTGLAQSGAEEPVKRLITGLVIVLAVLADYYRRRARRAR
jgi:ribose transport system permease protein